MMANMGNDNLEIDEDVLVTEFPPPPYYFRLASVQPTTTSDDTTTPTPTSTETPSLSTSPPSSSSILLTPPEIPTAALERASRRATEQRRKLQHETEVRRREAEASQVDLDQEREAGGGSDGGGGVSNNGSNGDGNGVGDGSGGDVGDGSGVGSSGGSSGGGEDAAAADRTATLNAEVLGGIVPDLNVVKDAEGDEGEADVAVFGEFVEDPLLAPVDDHCEEPTKVRDEVSRLNQKVLEGFVKLVEELVKNRPLANQKCRDELSHNIFLMLQECNKFREHQAREVLIETLEDHLRQKRTALEEMREEIKKTDSTLAQLEAVVVGDVDERGGSGGGEGMGIVPLVEEEEGDSTMD